MQDMPTTKAKPKKEKPIPKRCVCGKMPTTVSVRGGRMLTCPNPFACPGNLRTRWNKSIDAATVEWNGVVSEFRYKQKEG